MSQWIKSKVDLEEDILMGKESLFYLANGHRVHVLLLRLKECKGMIDATI